MTPSSTDSVKHTAGPWLLDRPSDAHVVDYNYHVITGGSGFHPERNGWGQGFRIAGSMCVADARLMAEAPILLACLEEALEFVEDQEDITDGPDGQPQPNKAMQLAQTLRAAIAKAHGGAV